VSGNSIIYGSEVVFDAATTDHISASALTAGKFAVAYRDYGNSNYGTAIIGDVSGNVITYGTEVAFHHANTDRISAAALTAGKFVVAYHDNDVLYYGMAVIGDVSGKVMTYGSETHLGTIGGDDISAAALSSAKFVAAYSAGNTGTAIISEVSGNVIAYGSAAVYNTGYAFDKSAAAMSEGKFVITYRDFDNSNFGTAIIGDVSGNVIT
jgi:hypothetical protein